MTETKIQPFPNGTSYMVWTEMNCDRCKKSGECKLEEALAVACVTDGAIPADVAKAIGCGPKGYAPTGCLAREDNGYVPPPPPPPMALVLRELRHVAEKLSEMTERAAAEAEWSEDAGGYPVGEWGSELVDGTLALVAVNEAIRIAEKALTVGEEV